MPVFKITELKEITVVATVQAYDAREAAKIHRRGTSHAPTITEDVSLTIEPYKEEETTHGK
jgi:hypothetical protein